MGANPVFNEGRAGRSACRSASTTSSRARRGRASRRGSGLRAGARRAAGLGHRPHEGARRLAWEDVFRAMSEGRPVRDPLRRRTGRTRNWPSVARPRPPSRNSLTFRTASRPSTTSIAFLPATPSSRPPRAAPALPRTPHRRRRGGLLRDDRTGGQHGSLRGRHGDLARGGR